MLIHFWRWTIFWIFFISWSSTANPFSQYRSYYILDLFSMKFSSFNVTHFYFFNCFSSVSTKSKNESNFFISPCLIFLFLKVKFYLTPFLIIKLLLAVSLFELILVMLLIWLLYFLSFNGDEFSDDFRLDSPYF